MSRKMTMMAALALAALASPSFMDSFPKREPIREKDPVKDAERIAEAQAKRLRKAQRRLAMQPKDNQ